MFPYNIINFSDIDFPQVSDSSNLADILVKNYQSEEEFAAIFEYIKDGQIPDDKYDEISKIFKETLPPTFLYQITLENGTLGDKTLFSPSQKFVLKYIQKTLYEMKDHESYHKLLTYFADQIIPQFSNDSKLFKFCGEVKVDRFKKIGILTHDDQVEIYSKESLFSIQQTLPLEDLPKQSKIWEQTRRELANGPISPLITVFRSFSALNSFDTLPVDVYSGFINYITSPDMLIVNKLLNKNFEDIELPLVTIFSHKNLHRRLLKYCIFQEVFSTDDASHLMRMNSQEVKVVIDFLTSQIRTLIDPGINKIKADICKAFNFDFTQNDPETISSMKKLTDIFIEGFINILPMMPSSVRYVCCIINEASKVKFKSLTCKGVFMAFFFRVIFPLICQPCPTDPPGLSVDIKKMAAFGKIMTSIFVEEYSHLAHFSAIAGLQEENVGKIFDRLTECDEPYDMIDQPSFTEACLSVDKIRKKCQKKASVLAVDDCGHSKILMLWLDLMKNI